MCFWQGSPIQPPSSARMMSLMETMPKSRRPSTTGTPEMWLRFIRFCAKCIVSVRTTEMMSWSRITSFTRRRCRSSMMTSGSPLPSEPGSPGPDTRLTCLRSCAAMIWSSLRLSPPLRIVGLYSITPRLRP